MKFTKDSVNDCLEEITYGDEKADNRRIHSLKLLLIFIVLIGGLGAFSFGLGALIGIIDNAPDIDNLSFSPMGYATTTYDTKGNLTATLIQ